MKDQNKNKEMVEVDVLCVFKDVKQAIITANRARHNIRTDPANDNLQIYTIK